MIPDQMKLTNQLCFSVYNANRLFIKFYQKALAPFHLTYAQYIVLLALWEKDNQTLHELGAELDFGSNTLTPVLKRLEAAGWVQRIRPAEDKRQLVVTLTQQAKVSEGAIFEAISACAGHMELDYHTYEQALETNDQLIAGLKKVVD